MKRNEMKTGKCKRTKWEFGVKWMKWKKNEKTYYHASVERRDAMAEHYNEHDHIEWTDSK